MQKCERAAAYLLHFVIEGQSCLAWSAKPINVVTRLAESPSKVDSIDFDVVLPFVDLENAIQIRSVQDLKGKIVGIYPAGARLIFSPK